MIVQCDKCQTKFRIADEKVRPNGVKVRCSRCAHVFVVHRAPTSDPSHTNAPVVPTPSGLSPGLPTSRAKIPASAATASSLEAAAALGFSGLPTPAKKAPLPPLSGSRDTLRSFTASEALTQQAHTTESDDLDFPFDIDEDSAESLGSPGAPVGSQVDDPFGLEPTIGAAQMERSKATSNGHANPLDGGAADPFAGAPDPFGSGSYASAPSDGDPFGANADPFGDAKSVEEVPFTDLEPTADRLHVTERFGPVEEALRAEKRDPFGEATPFGAGADEGPPPLPASRRKSSDLPPFPSTPTSSLLLDDNISSGSRKSPFAEAPQRVRDDASDRFPAFDPEEKDEGAATEMNLPGLDGPGDSGNFPPPASFGPSATAFGKDGPANTGAFPPPTDFGPNAAPAHVDELGDIPGLMPNESPDDDPFGGIDPDSGSVGAYSDFTGVRDDLNPPTPNGSSKEALAKIALGTAHMPTFGDGVSHHEPTAIARAYQPPSVRNKSGLFVADPEEGLGWWPTVLGIAAGLAIAALYVPGVAEYAAPYLGRDGASALTVTDDAPLVPGSIDEVVAKDTFIRAYPNADGRELLVVGGEAAASAAVGEVEAVVVVLDGDRVVDRRSSPVGAVIDEAALHAAKTESYLSNAVAAQSPRALASGESARFLVVFWTPPPNAEAHTYRVAFVKANASARAENP